MKPICFALGVGTLLVAAYAIADPAAAPAAAPVPAAVSADQAQAAGSQQAFDESTPSNKLDQDGKVRVGGQVKSAYVDLGLYGNYFPTAERYRPWNQYLDLKFTVQPVDDLSAEAVFRFENIFGAYWGVQNIYGVRRLVIKGNYPVTFELGDYNAKLTTLTLATSDDDQPFQAEYFKDKLQRNRDEVFLYADQSWPLTGYRVGFDQVLDEADHIRMKVESFGARLGVAGEATNFNTFAFDQYLLVGDAKFDITSDVNLGFNFLDQFDVQDTGSSSSPAFTDKIYEATGSVFLWPKLASVSADWAQSLSNTNTGVTDYLRDTAVKLGFQVDTEIVAVKLGYSQVGGDYVAPGAQTRLRSESTNLPILTENNTWDASSNWANTPPIAPHYGTLFPLTNYNNRILAGVRLPFYPYENNTLPYGDATPNREVTRGSVTVQAWQKFIQPTLDYLRGRELADSAGGDGRRSFTRWGIGSKFAWEMLALTVGYQNEDTNNGNHIALTTSTVHAGLEAQLLPQIALLLGYQHLDFNGSEFIGNYFQTYLDNVIDQYGFELRGRFDPNVEVLFGYQLSKFMAFANAADNFDGHEFDAVIRFGF